MSGDEGANRKRGLGARLAAIAGAIEHALDAVGEVVQSAGELLVDNDLRRKGAQYIVEGASRSIDEAQRGIEAGAQTLQAGARARIGAGARQLQNVLRNIERQVQDFQKQQQQRDLQAELQHHHKLPVDIQVGHQLLEDMPQEMRSRFWYVLLQRPDLALALMSDAQPRQTTGNHQQGASRTAAARADAAAGGGVGASSSSGSSGSDSSSSSALTAAAAAANGSIGLSHLQCSSAGGCEPACAEAAPVSPFASYCDSPEPSTDLPAPAAAAAAAAPAPQQQEPGALLQVAELTAQPAEAAPDCISTEGESVQTAAAEEEEEEKEEEGPHAESGSRLATIDRVPDIDDLLTQPTADSLEPQQQMEQMQPEPAADHGAAEAPGASVTADGSSNGTAAAPAPNAAAGDDISRFLTAVPAVVPSPWEAGSAANRHSSCSSSSAVSSNPSAPSPWAVLSPTSAAADGDAAGRDSSSSSHAASGAAPEQAAASGEGDGWELVSRDVPSAAVGGDAGSGNNNGSSTGNGASPFELETLATLQSLVQSLSAEELSDPALVAQQAVFRLMAEVPWTAGTGVPSDWQQDSEYTALLEAGCGPVEEVILRDVPRTFPEHPLFSAGAEGQQRLLRLLKAYAAADPEVGYCQGMAFAAGVLLMYLPEEAAFRLYRRIMTAGPTLRRLYLPGLEQLKLELARFELLLAAHDPELHAHLAEAGLPALLYAAQWLMTCFACPFPVHVAGRLLDVLLQSGGDGVLPRLGLAVMAELREQLLALDDFEALITAIKVKPLSWPLAIHRQVIDAALYSPATDAELAATSAAVEAEFARLGRPASFSARHLSRQHEAAAALASSGSSGCISRSCELPAAGARPAAVAAGAADTGDAAQGQTAAQPEPQQLSGSSSDVLRGGQGSGLLGEMDLHLLAEMDMLLVGADGLATSPPAGAAEAAAAPPGGDAE